MSSEQKPGSTRVLVVDAVRAAAVLCMIQWHCADAWIGGTLRQSDAFGLTRIVGGFAAPLFLLLAGVSAALVFRPERAWGGVRRGVEILAGGYAFKLWAWSVDYGALVERHNWPAIVLEGALLFTIVRAATAEKITPARRASFAVLALLLWIATLVAMRSATRSPYVVSRLDVLQGIGAALIVVNGVLYLAHRFRAPPIALAILAIGVALVTPSFVGVDLSWLPTRLADYVARTTADPALSGARFPLFPWLGYTLLGAAIGAAVRARPLRDAWDVPFAANGYLALGAAILVGLCVFEPMPAAQWLLARTEQVRNLIRLVWNTAIAAGIAGMASITLPQLPRVQRAMLSLGRHSLIVYVVHLEIAFGLPCSPIRETFGFGGWAVGASLLLASMIALSYALDARDARRALLDRPHGRAAPLARS
jgi:uncharacterized membrane protein